MLTLRCALCFWRRVVWRFWLVKSGGLVVVSSNLATPTTPYTHNLCVYFFVPYRTFYIFETTSGTSISSGVNPPCEPLCGRLGVLPG
jgi:hypothetical protein